MHDSRQYNHSSGSLHASWPWATHPVVQVDICSCLTSHCCSLLQATSSKELIQCGQWGITLVLGCAFALLLLLFQQLCNQDLQFHKPATVITWYPTIVSSSCWHKSHLLMNLFADERRVPPSEFQFGRWFLKMMTILVLCRVVLPGKIAKYYMTSP